ncbi:hypothetical protein ACFYP4_02370 [Streptomyces sp. NPDC005551]|uniref:hypothetical protein n=1 Tax=Streptomyces sp. NPDC005551 TaxID=3364725 RepID=UPI003682D9C2
MQKNYEDLTVHVRMLTRTCVACGVPGEFPYVRAENANGKTPTWREAERQREAWWTEHAKKCIPVRHRLYAV